MIEGPNTGQEFESSLHVFSFSGCIVLDTDSQLEPCEFSRGAVKIIVEAPRRLASPTWRPIPQISDGNLEELIPGAPSMIGPLRMSAFPLLKGVGSVTLFWGDHDTEEHVLPKDTLLIHVYNGGPRWQSIAESVEYDLLTWLRVLSQQWWIGMPTENLTGHRHLMMRLTGYRQIEGFPVPVTRQTTADSMARPVDASIWKDAVGRVARKIEVDVNELLFLDAQHSFFTGDMLSAMVRLCASWEMKRDSIIARKGISKKTTKLNGTNLPMHLSDGFRDLIGRNMETEEPTTFHFLESCWKTRQSAAHGKLLVWREVGKPPVSFEHVKSTDFFQRARDVQRWLNTV